MPRQLHQRVNRWLLLQQLVEFVTGATPWAVLQFARAVAGELDAAFFVAKASNLMSQWFGKAEPNVAAFVAGQPPKKVIVVPGKFVNIVV